MKRKNIEELSSNTLQTLKRKYKRAKCSLKLRFPVSIALGQSSQLADILSDDDDCEGGAQTNEMTAMIEVYDASDKIWKSII